MISRIFLLLLTSTFLVSTFAYSPQSRPLKRLEHPASVSLQILSRNVPTADRLSQKRSNNNQNSLPNAQLLYSDNLRITLEAFSDTFHLHLTPNNDLIHPEARVTYYKLAADGSGRSVIDRVEPLQRESILVYGGQVIHDDYTDFIISEQNAGGVWRPYGSTMPGERGWARITVMDAGDPTTGRSPVLEGAFSVDGIIHHILTKDSYLKKKLPLDPLPIADSELVIFRDLDVMSPEEEEFERTGLYRQRKQPYPRPLSCAHDRLSFNTDTRKNPVLRFGAGYDRIPQYSWYDPLGMMSPDEPRTASTNGSVVKRQGDIGGGNAGSSNFVNNIGQIAGCPTTQQIVYMGVASDCTYTRQHGGDTNTTQQILRNFNTVSLLYKSTFNISLGIVELQISDEECPASDPANPWNLACASASLNERLSLFSAWRGQKFSQLGEGDNAGLWHMMSGCPSGTEVGVAWLGTLCMKSSTGNAPSIVSGAAVSTGGRTEWQVIAHEIGHNFGAIHDCADNCSLTDNCCPLSRGTCDTNAQFLMSPVSSSNERIFSPCTVGNICSLMLSQSVDMSCVQPPSADIRTIALQQCGNGIVEAGEDCDPGTGAESSCCDPATCKFRPGALCDPSGSSCCTTTCQFAPASQVCRPSKDNRCDTAETCTGNSAECPKDVTSPNGQSCGPDGLACAMGTCTSISQQCRVVGASLNLTNACPNQNDSSCQISCQDPSNFNQCVVLNSQLVDGSPCGFGGTCLSGNCQPGSFFESAMAWYRQNLQISIPVSVVAGIVVLIIFWSILTGVKRCLTRKKQTKKVPEPSTSSAAVIPANVPAQRIPSWAPPTRVNPPTLPTPMYGGPFNILTPRLGPGTPVKDGRITSIGELRPGSSGSRPSTAQRPLLGSSQGPRPPNDASRPDTGASSSASVTQPQYPLPPSYGRQSTWVSGGGSRTLTDAPLPPPPPNAPLPPRPTEDRAKWVDEAKWNGPQR